MKKIFFLALACLSYSYINAQDNAAAGSSSAKPDYGYNIITLTPMQIINNNNDNRYYNNGADVAVGMSYERILSNQYIGLKLPFSISLRNPGFFYIMPAIKLYPKKQGIVKYAVGPQFLIATGEIKYHTTYYSSNYPNYVDSTFTEKSTQLGFMINNSLNITVAKQFYVGMELGIGIQYFDSRQNDNAGNSNTYDNPYEANVQFNFNMGYRF